MTYIFKDPRDGHINIVILLILMIFNYILFDIIYSNNYKKNLK